MIIYLTAGSLGLAYYRLLYVKFPHWVKFSIGENCLLCVISTSGFGISLLSTLLFGKGHAKSRAALNLCLGRSSYISVVSIMYFYFLMVFNPCILAIYLFQLLYISWSSNCATLSCTWGFHISSTLTKNVPYFMLPSPTFIYYFFLT